MNHRIEVSLVKVINKTKKTFRLFPHVTKIPVYGPKETYDKKPITFDTTNILKEIKI